MVIRLKAKPVTVEAVLWSGGPESFEQVYNFIIDNRGTWSYVGNELKVWNKLERQWCNVPIGHYVIKGLEGEFYPFEYEACLKKYEVLLDDEE